MQVRLELKQGTLHDIFSAAYFTWSSNTYEPRVTLQQHNLPVPSTQGSITEMSCMATEPDPSDASLQLTRPCWASQSRHSKVKLLYRLLDDCRVSSCC